MYVYTVYIGQQLHHKPLSILLDCPTIAVTEFDVTQHHHTEEASSYHQ